MNEVCEESDMAGNCDNKESTEILMNSLIMNEPYVTQYYRDIFDGCDINKDGRISIKELKKFIETQEDHHIPHHLIKTIHAYFDRNGDARLDFEEFLEMMNNPIIAKTFKRMRSRYLKYVVITPSQQKIKLVSPITRTGLYEEESSCKITTIGMVTLSAIQILLYYINLAFESGPIKSALQFDPKRKYEIWRYVSYIFVHANPVHLYPNVFIQIIIGVPLEMVHGWRVLVIYVAGAFGACLAHSVIDPNVTLVGSSGGFYAFYTAHIATVIMNWREMSHPSVQLILFGIMTVFDPVYNYVIMKGEGNVSYIAHLGGTVIGLLLGVNILKNLQVTKTEQIVWYICMITYAIIMIIFIVLDILNSI